MALHIGAPARAGNGEIFPGHEWPLRIRSSRARRTLHSVVVAFLGATIAQLAHVEVLLTLLTAGFVTENVSRFEDGEAIRRAMERSAAPVFVVFFALAVQPAAVSSGATFAPTPSLTEP